MSRNYEYGELFNSLLRYLGDVAKRIKAKHPDLPMLNVVYLDSVTDFAKLPKGDFIFLSSWTIDCDGNRYGDKHDMLLGFCAVNDVNGSKLEAVYMNQLMKEVTYRTNSNCTQIGILSGDGSEQIGVLVYSSNYFTNAPRVDDSRTFRSVSVTMLSPQRLKNESST